MTDEDFNPLTSFHFLSLQYNLSQYFIKALFSIYIIVTLYFIITSPQRETLDALAVTLCFHFPQPLAITKHDVDLPILGILYE